MAQDLEPRNPSGDRPDRPRTPSPFAHPEPEPSGFPILRSLLLSGGVALLCGGLGAWGYQNYLQRYLATPSAPGDSKHATAGSVAADVKALQARVDDLTQRIEQAKGQAASPPLAQSVNTLDARVGTLGKQVERLLAESEESHAGRARLVSAAPGEPDGEKPKTEPNAKHEVLKPKPEEPKAGPNAKRDVLKPRPEEPRTGSRADVEVAGAAFGQGAQLFEKGKYTEALAVFRKLQATHSDDARVWYFSALANGFGTKQWRGETERLVNKGIERERAGTPPANQIDAALSILTSATGKDWLAAYRKRVAK